MRRFFLSSFCVFSFFCSLSFFVPTLHSQTITNPSLWLKPTFVQGSSDSTVSFITSGIPSSIPSDTNLRTASLINYNPGISSVDSLPFTIPLPDSLLSCKTVTVITAYLTESSDKAGLWEVSKDTLRPLWLNTQELSYGDKSLTYRDTTETGPIVNICRFNIATDTLGTGIYTLRLLIEDSNFFSGTFGEYLYFDTILPPLHERYWETGLSIKYGATLKRDYIGSSGDTLWKVKEDSTYSIGVCGLGKDISTTLHQSRSRIYKDIISIETEHNQLPESSYLLWGHNGMDTVPSEPFQTDTLEFLQLLRHWKIKPTFASENSTPLHTTLSYTYPSNAFPGGIALFIDRTSSFGFDPYACEIYFPDSADARTVYFNNILWDTDQSGSDYFGIAILSDSLSRGLLSKGTSAEDVSTSLSTSDTFTLTLHPNPSSGMFSLDINQSSREPLTVTITDNTGKVVRRYAKPDAGHYTKIEDTIDTMGVYFIQVETPTFRKTVKLVIAR